MISPWLRTYARFMLGTVAFNESTAAIGRHRARVRMFNAAKGRAVETDRQLVVVGAPGNGFHTRIIPAYDCGDVCVDLTGCAECPVSVEVDLTVGKVDIVDDNTAVVFVSCVLEYVSDPAAVWAEIMRMAGTADNVFMVTVRPTSATAALYPGARFIIDQEGGSISYTRIPAPVKVAVAGGVALLAILSFMPIGTRTSAAPRLTEKRLVYGRMV